MVGFYYLDKTLYKHIKKTYKNKNIIIQTVSGCFAIYSVSLADILTELEKGAFDDYIPKDILKKQKSIKSKK